MAINQIAGSKFYRICCTDNLGAMDCSEWVEVVVGLCALPPPPPPPGEPQFDVTLTPGQNLAQIVNNNPAGTRYLLLNGVHLFNNVVVKNGDQFWGQTRAGTIIDGSAFGPQTAAADTKSAFTGAGDDAIITRMTIRNFGNGTAPNLQEQAGILGKTVHWALGVVQQAFRWRIHDCTIHSNGIGGIYAGHDFTITGCEIYDHDVTGIGAAYIAGGLWQGNDIHNNATNPAVGAGDNGAGIKVVNINNVSGFVPMPPNKALEIIDNDVYDNFPGPGLGRPLWADIDCHDVNFRHNRVTESAGGLFGIMYELSNDNIAECNTITGPIGYGAWAGGNFVNAALCAAESHNIVFFRNTVIDARRGFMNRLSPRGTQEGGDPYPTTLANSGQLSLAHNAIGPNALSNIGCSTNSLIENTFINVDEFGDNYGTGHQGLDLPNTMIYQNNDISQSPGIQHYFGGAPAAFPGNGRS